MSERILIIDDEEHIRRMMRLTLEAAGYVVGEAGNGLEGVKLYGDGSNWDLIVLDQRMPGIDGLETLRRLKEVDPAARVVMATAYASIELAVDAMKLGAADFVRKPMTPERLRNAVAAALAKLKPAVAASAATATAPLLPRIETLTMNGFSIVDADQNDWQLPDERRFTVMSPTGARYEVLVQIEESVVDYLERITRRRLRLESSFWTEQARRFLADYLWNNTDVPRTRKLTVSELSREELLIAETWTDE